MPVVVLVMRSIIVIMSMTMIVVLALATIMVMLTLVVGDMVVAARFSHATSL